MDKDPVKSKTKNYIILAISAVLITTLVIILASSGNNSNNKNSGKNQNTTTPGSDFQLTDLPQKQYQDDTCNLTFSIPQDWEKSDITLPLPQQPLSQATFNQPASQNTPAKNSILSFICYDASEYSFSQFLDQNPTQAQTSQLKIGGLEWKRTGTFAHTTKNNQLLIFQMFFTKHDLKPRSGYEEQFMKTLESVSL
jgi:hypothetical protein